MVDETDPKWFAPIMILFVPTVTMFWTMQLMYSSHSEYHYNAVQPSRFMMAVVLNLAIILRSLQRNSLTITGNLVALWMGFCIALINRSVFMCLMVFFFSGTRLTKINAHRKASLDASYVINEARSATQVICNAGALYFYALSYLSVAGFVELSLNFSSHYYATHYQLSMIAALSCACGDTWASEIGTAFGTLRPFHPVCMRRVPAGTNGGITFIGTLASCLGGALIGCTYFLSNCVFCYESSSFITIFIYSTLCGFTGSIIDSILGGSLQYSGWDEELKKVVSKPSEHSKTISGVNLFSNNIINFISCAVTSFIMPSIFYYILDF